MAEIHAQQWEYRREARPETDALGGLGADGWELVAIDPSDGAYLFKRPGATFRERVTLQQKERVYQLRSRLREAEA